MMKTINYLAVIAATIVTTTSCVENSGKYKALVAQKDSLQSSMNVMETEFNETLQTLNEVEEGFRAIAAEEGKVTLNMESAGSKKDQIVAQMSQMKEILAQNKETIAQLKSKLAVSGKNNKVLTETIKRMEEQLNENTITIAQLQEELAKKNIKIEELTVSVNNLNTNVANLEEKSANQQGIIKEMDADLNAVWYCIATSRELKEANIKSSGKVLNKDFKKGAFIQADLREVTSIALNARRVKMLSSHPEGSYKIEVGADKMETLVITNPAQFWSISKYLVMQK